MRFRVFIVLLTCLLAHKLFAQNNLYQFSHLDINDGLSNNQVNCIFKDAKGFMWFGTTSGLNRYDGYKFKTFKHDAKNPNSLANDYLVRICEGPDNKMWLYTYAGFSIYNAETESFTNTAAELSKYKIATWDIKFIKKDRGGNYWFLTNNNKGVYCYHPKTAKTDFYNHSARSKALLHSSAVSDVAFGKNGLVWIIYADGAIERMDAIQNKIIQTEAALSKVVLATNSDYRMILGEDDNLWIRINGSPRGVFLFDAKNSTVRNFDKDTPGSKLNSNVIHNVIQGDGHQVWVGTDHGGINLIDQTTFKVKYLLNRDDDPKSLSGNSVVLYKDNEGMIWAGSNKQGISYYHKGIFQFPIVKHYSSDPASLPFDDVNNFAEDKKGNLWIGTNGGGLVYYNQATKTYTQYRQNLNNANSLTNDIVTSLYIDHENKLWIGTYFGGLDCFDGKTFTHYRHNAKDPSSISDDRVFTILENRPGELWLGTFEGGINIFNTSTRKFSHTYNGDVLHSSYVSIIYKDKRSNIWLGGSSGLHLIDGKTGRIKHFTHQANKPNSLIDNNINSIIEGHNGLVWIGTRGGLSIYDPQKDNFFNIIQPDGLPSNSINGLLEDRDGKTWISTTNGIASISLIKKGNKYQYLINNYNELDGLQGREFNVSALLKTRDGHLIFGGAQGFNIFDPKNIHALSNKPNLVFTDFELFNQNVAVGDTIKGSVVLNKSITQTREITLNHQQNVFSIEFAACDYFNPNKIQYQYKLAGFDKGWLTAKGNFRKATYTNLDAGDYVFEVMATNLNDPAKNSTVSLKIKVLPPFWKSNWAYALYLLSAISLLFYIRHRGILKLKSEFELTQQKIEAERKMAQEREEAKRMHELDLMKIKFFTNVSHEFRTPLSLIISPIENLVKNSTQPGQQDQLLMIKRNGRRLLNLVNQLLDFRKMEFKELKLNLIKGDIISYIKEVSASFTDVAHQNQIEYLFDSEVEELVTKFDHDKVERVLFNLLSNAFKFTLPGGSISVMLNLLNSAETAEVQLLEIKVIDTGIGIAKDKQEKVFERFYQDDIPGTLVNQGSGIGLSITREFVKLQGGSIKLESEPGYGSCFTVSLPLTIICENVIVPADTKQTLSTRTEEKVSGLAKKPIILVVEDNDDLRHYLKDNLKHKFQIVEAANGKEGWQKALSLHPDLILSDVNMPEMDGIHLCKKMKSDHRTAHIPVILLTALTEEEEHLAGLESGANDYITKPFNLEILLSKIQNLLRLQQTIKKTFRKQIEVDVQEMDIQSEDTKFVKNALDCIEKNIINPNFSVEELSRQLSLSRVSLYKKLLTLTGKTPVDFIRNIRLKKAVQLLQKSKLNIANVAYEVGFSTPTYFAKVFREEYGMLPSEYINELRKKEKEVLDSVD